MLLCLFLLTRRCARFEGVNVFLEQPHAFKRLPLSFPYSTALMVLQVVRTSLFWLLLTVLNGFQGYLQTPTIPWDHPNLLRSTNAVSKTILPSETHSTLDCPPSSWWITPTHSKKDREKGSNLWEKNTTNHALYCFIIPKISFSLLDTCNKSSNQKYPASLKHFSEIGLLG